MDQQGRWLNETINLLKSIGGINEYFNYVSFSSGDALDDLLTPAVVQHRDSEQASDGETMR